MVLAVPCELGRVCILLLLGDVACRCQLTDVEFSYVFTDFMAARFVHF